MKLEAAIDIVVDRAFPLNLPFPRAFLASQGAEQKACFVRKRERQESEEWRAESSLGAAFSSEMFGDLCWHCRRFERGGEAKTSCECQLVKYTRQSMLFIPLGQLSIQLYKGC